MRGTKALLYACLGMAAVALFLSIDLFPPPDDAQAQRRGSMPYASNFDSKVWYKATDGSAEALTARARWWALTIKLGSNAADSVEVKVHETYANEWTTLTFPGEVVVGRTQMLMYYGPEIDSVEVFTGTLAWCRIDYWW